MSKSTEIQFAHVRLFHLSEDILGKVRIDGLSANGGVTIAYQALPGGKVEYALAVCTLDDTFCKSRGRTIAVGRLEASRATGGKGNMCGAWYELAENQDNNEYDTLMAKSAHEIAIDELLVYFGRHVGLELRNIGLGVVGFTAGTVYEYNTDPNILLRRSEDPDTDKRQHITPAGFRIPVNTPPGFAARTAPDCTSQ